MANIHDVARAAGVSIKTVSRVLNGEPNVRLKTKAAVEAAIDALNYVPSHFARAMKSGQSKTIAFLTDSVVTSPESISAATNKRMKALGFEDHSSHNLRHTSKRLMRDAGVTKDVTDIIHGHAGSTVADTYGRGVALSRMKEALEKGFQGLRG